MVLRSSRFSNVYTQVLLTNPASIDGALVVAAGSVTALAGVGGVGFRRYKC